MHGPLFIPIFRVMQRLVDRHFSRGGRGSRGIRVAAGGQIPQGGGGPGEQQGGILREGVLQQQQETGRGRLHTRVRAGAQAREQAADAVGDVRRRVRGGGGSRGQRHD